MSIENEHPLEEHIQENNSSEEETEEEDTFLKNIHFKYNEEGFKKRKYFEIFI